MLRLITKADFVGFLTIQFSETDDVFDTYQDQVEQRYMVDLFGKEMYDDMVLNPTEANYAYLIDNYLTDMMKGIFYYEFNLDRESYSSTLGQFESDAQNAQRNRASRNMKTIERWNDGVKLYLECAKYVNDNIEDYPLYTETIMKYRQNVWGIGNAYNVDTSYPDDWFIRGYPV